MNGEGPFGAGIAFIGEAPGEKEDLMGRPFVGRSGKFLDSVLTASGLDRKKVFITNVVRCRPPGNRRPNDGEISSCRPRLIGELNEVRPNVIVTLGASALYALTGFSGRLGDVVGKEQSIELSGRVLPLVPNYHPSVVMRKKSLRAPFAAAIKRAMALSK